MAHCNAPHCALTACFEQGVAAETSTAIAQNKPYYFVMRDRSPADDSAGANCKQILALNNPA
jgi:adenine-specific DNA-methyltransferase